MENKLTRNSKLGIFVLAGLVFLVLLLYMIGKNQNLFGSTFTLKAHFENVQGLSSGNNIRYSGIHAGTVKEVTILNDTLIEVTMNIRKRLKKHIRKNAFASIGTDGLVGNKIINILPVKEPASYVEDGDTLCAKKTIDTDEMLQSLAKTAENISYIAGELKTTVSRINSSQTLWKLLDDESLPKNIRTSLVNVRLATSNAVDVTGNLDELVKGIKDGKGSLGTLLTDTSFAGNLTEAIEKIKSVGEEADRLANELSAATANLNTEMTNGKGMITALLKDSSMVNTVNKSLENIQKGTDDFNEIMDALKHSFLFRGYFRKMESKKQKK